MEILTDIIEDTDQKMFLAVFLSLAVAAFLIGLGFLTTDATHHMFFTKHYMNDWFSLIDFQTGGGIDISTYPPLAYQMIALLSFVLPLKVSYWAVLLLFWVNLSIFSAKFFTDFLDLGRDVEWMVYLFIFSGVSVLKTVFVHGQMTTIVGLGFGFMALYFLNRSIDTRKKKDMILFGLSYALVAFSHQFSFVLTSFLLLSIAASRRESILERDYMEDFVPSLASTGTIAAIGLSPMLLTLFGGSMAASQEIPHFSRVSIFNLTSIQLESVFFLTYGLSGLMVLFPLYINIFDEEKHRRYITLYGTALFFLVMGLGHTTPLPRLIFGGWSNWITYDRFTLVASIIFTGLLAVLTQKLVKGRGYENRDFVSSIVVIMVILCSIFGLLRAHQIAYGDPVDSSEPFREEVTEYILSYLDDSSANYRYQTFGYGEPIAQLYLNTDVPTLDTWYFTGRQKKWLRNSSVEAIDGASEDFVHKFMDHATQESVKYIFTAKEPYHELIKSYDWQKKQVMHFGERKVIAWENPENVSKISSHREDKNISNYLWGIVPLLTLAIFVSFSFLRPEIDQDQSITSLISSIV